MHKRTHSGDKIFPCDQCPKSFSRADNLNFKIKFQHVEKMWASFSSVVQHISCIKFDQELNVRLTLKKKYSLNIYIININ